MKNNKWRGYISLVLVVAMMFATVFGVKVASQSSAPSAGGTLADAADGTYVGEAQGFGGPIVAEVTIQGGKITDVKVTGEKETPNLGAVAVETLPGKILDAQSLNVDVVSGATVSSNAIFAAVTAALAEAGVDASKLTGESGGGAVAKTDESVDVDIVVVGGGGAGMAAAIQAKQAGKNVIILEKMPYVGGNTVKASGGMNAAGTKNQAAAAKKEKDPEVKKAILDSTVENYIKDTLKGGHDINDKSLVRTMAEKSASAIEWLESIGAPLPTIAPTGGTVHQYLHEPEDGSAVGEYLVEKFKAKVEELKIPVYLDTEATEIIMKDNKAAGVKAESDKVNYTINAKAVVLATGGFGANEEMYCKYNADLKGTVTTNAPGATGDGIVMAEKVGAATVDMEQIQLHPTVFQENGFLVSERLRSNGAILVNKDGKRFTNDLATRDAVSQAELKQPDKFAFIVYDSQFAEEKLYQKYVTNKLTVSADTIDGLAKEMGLTGAAAKNFAETVTKWNKAVDTKKDEFGRDNGLVKLEKGPYFAIKIAPGIHHTMGGLKINTKTQVLDAKGNAISGLFAAGEVTGGVHGGNRIGGNAVADIVVYGRIAGESACSYVDAK